MEAMKTKIVVVGNGMVGYKFLEKLVNKPNSSTFEIIVFGEEPRVAYDRVHLSEYFGEKTIEELTMAPIDWYHDNNIKIHIGDPVQSINRDLKTIHLNDLTFHLIN